MEHPCGDDLTELKKRLEETNQSHLLKFWPDLSAEEQENLLAEIREIDIPAVNGFFKARFSECMRAPVKVDDRLQPVPDDVYGAASTSDSATLDRYFDLGLKAISNGEVGALLLAGGQGTRLGVKYPKGMYDVGLPSGKTLYQIQAERITRVKELARRKFGGSCHLPWYIMTSEHTMGATQKFFSKHQHFGLDEDAVVFFEQHTLPAVDFDGHILLENKHKIAKAPDGNGGLYRALRDQGMLEDMSSRGVRYLFVYCVDNILVRLADPWFVGFCIEKKVECGNKVVEKSNPSEAVGVTGLVDGKFQVVEYSEISADTAAQRTACGGKLLFRAGNIANHFFTLDFVKKVCLEHERDLVHHVAKKKVPTVSEDGMTVVPTAPNGVKMEKFVFDVFPFAKSFAVWEVEREEEFSPLKNPPGAPRDAPEHCRRDLLTLHRRWLHSAGLLPSNGPDGKMEVELSPLVTYAGEDLLSATETLEIGAKSPALLERLPSGAFVLR